MKKKLLLILLTSLFVNIYSFNTFAESIEAESIIYNDRGLIVINESILDFIDDTQLKRLNINILKSYLGNIKSNENKDRLTKIIKEMEDSGITKDDKSLMDPEVIYIRDNKLFIPPSQKIELSRVEQEELLKDDLTDVVEDTDESTDTVSGDNSDFIEEIVIDEKLEENFSNSNDYSLVNRTENDTSNSFETILSLEEGQDYEYDGENTYVLESKTNVEELRKKGYKVDDSRLADINIADADYDDIEKYMSDVKYVSDSLMTAIYETDDIIVYDAKGRVTDVTQPIMKYTPINVPIRPIKRIYKELPYINEISLLILSIILIMTIIIAFKQGLKINKMEEKYEKRKMFLFKDEKKIEFDDYSDERYNINTGSKI